MTKNKVTAKLVLQSRNEKKGKQLKLRIIKNRKPKFISLGFYIKGYQKNQYWSEKSGLSPKYPEYDAVFSKYNKEVEGLKLKSEYREDIIHDLTNNNIIEYSTINSLATATVATNVVNFLKYWEERRDHLDNINKTGTARKYTTVINSLLKFLKNEDIEFESLSKKLFIEYKEWLELRGIQPITVKSYLEKIKSAINLAIKNDVFEPPTAWKHPFKDFQMPSVITKSKHIEIKQFERFEDAVLNGNKLSAISKKGGFKWLFQYYMFGMRVGDLLTLRWENIIGDGTRVKYTMRKTTKDNDIELNYNAAKIICLYHNIPAEGNLDILMFNIQLEVNIKRDEIIFSTIRKVHEGKRLHQAIENQISRYNKELKVTSNEFNEIYYENIYLTSHMARHQFAYNARLSGTDIYFISKALQHSSIKTTETYLGTFTFPDLDGKFYQKQYSKKEEKDIDERLKGLLKSTDYHTKEKMLSQFKG